jgi:hypothetical protein
LITKELQSNKALKTIKEIEAFNRITIDLLKDIVQFFIAVDNYNNQNNKVIEDFFLFKTNIEDGFKNLGQFDLKIKDYFSNNDSSIAMKEYCLSTIKKSFYFLNNNFFIYIEKCPLKSDYDNLINILERSISKEEIGLSPMLNPNSKKINEKFKESNFIDFIKNVTDKEAFAEEFKNTFNIESGIDFKIIIELLRDQNIFIIGERKFLLFYECTQLFMQRNFGAYSALNDKYKHSDSDKKVHSSRIGKIYDKLQPMIDKYKTK